MASVKFYLEKRRDQNGRIKTRNVPVLLYFSYDGRRLQLNTGEKTDFENWDFESQKIRKEVSFSEQVNAYLGSLAGEIMDLYREARKAGIKPGNSYFREQLKKKRTHSGVDFFDAFMKFIEKKNENWSIYTFRKIKTNYRHLRDFADNSGYVIDFNRINEDFYRKYIDYFHHKGHTNATILKNLNVLKWFLNWSTQKGYNKNTCYREFRFPWDSSYKAEPADQYLEWDELMSLYRAEIEEKYLYEARDVFCFMCFTGLKHTQVRFLNMNHNSPNDINLLQFQGNGGLSLGFYQHAQEILGRYGENSTGHRNFPSISIVDMNKRIKAAGRVAGINRPVKIQIVKGHEKLVKEIPKYQLLSTKVARNTFIFHAFRAGLPLQSMMRLTGLKTLYSITKFNALCH
ncbi:MAG: hypothetical protein AMS27_14025 [Bacteroides sp. SM23_62_1]|nr:MAG: hypothetical protein AMS27_14025 [Bacteroides sp. SM23_62_1]